MSPTVALSPQGVSSGLVASPVKDSFRHSFGSQSSSATATTTTTTTSTSSRRFSVASSDISIEGDLEQQQTGTTEVEQIVNCKYLKYYTHIVNSKLYPALNKSHFSYSFYAYIIITFITIFIIWSNNF
jgi:hypothetical protein